MFVCVFRDSVHVCICMYLHALLYMHYPSISVSVFFVCECSLPGGPDCPMRGEQADLLFCLLSGHSSEHWPSPKLKPLASSQTQHRAAPTGTQWHWIICACQLAVNEKVNRYEPGCGWEKNRTAQWWFYHRIMADSLRDRAFLSVVSDNLFKKPLKMFAPCFKLWVDVIWIWFALRNGLMAFWNTTLSCFQWRVIITCLSLGW